MKNTMKELSLNIVLEIAKLQRLSDLAYTDNRSLYLELKQMQTLATNILQSLMEETDAT